MTSKPRHDVPVFIRSNDDKKIALAAAGYPATGPVTLQHAPEGDKYTNLSAQWMLVEHGDLYTILLYPSDGNRCLQASGSTVGAAVVVGPVDPSNRLQLWRFSSDGHIACAGAPGTELGFVGDLPIPGLLLQITLEHDSHNTGDLFHVDVVAGG